jgi:hypothetical protein
VYVYICTCVWVGRWVEIGCGTNSVGRSPGWNVGFGYKGPCDRETMKIGQQAVAQAALMGSQWQSNLLSDALEPSVHVCLSRRRGRGDGGRPEGKYVSAPCSLLLSRVPCAILGNTIIITQPGYAIQDAAAAMPIAINIKITL